MAHFDEQDRSLKESLISWMKVHNKDKSLIMMIHSLSMAKWGGSIRESHGYGDAALQEVHGLQANYFQLPDPSTTNHSNASKFISTRHLALSLQYFHGHPCTVVETQNSGTHQPQLLAVPFSSSLNCLLVSPCACLT